jgi:hypothetical protein
MEPLSSERPSPTTIAVDNSLIFLTVVVNARGHFCYLYDTKARTHIFYSVYSVPISLEELARERRRESTIATA